MRWRREDAGYAAATLFAASLVAYLTVANFGLVPSPFVPAEFSGPRAIGVPAFQTLPTAAQGGALAAGVAAVQVPTIPDLSPPVAVEQAPEVAGDTVPPSVAIATPDGSIIVTSADGPVRGTAADDSSGVDAVVVTFTPAVGQPTVVQAELDCPAGLTCTWTVEAPSLIGNYRVEAEAFDRAGNSATAGPITVTIVELPLASGASSDDALVSSAVDAVLGGLGALLGALL